MKYQDLVIKDGKFIGEFEELYQKFDNPWNQENEIYSSSISRRAVCHFIERLEINSIIEWGCGLGATSNFIKRNTNKEIQITGIDVSETAIKKAKAKYKDIEFITDDISNIASYKKHDCIFFSEITWYLLENKILDNCFTSMQNLSNKPYYFFHQLSFYKDGIQKYGKNYFSNLSQFIDFCPFELTAKVECEFEDGIDTLAIFKVL